MAEVQFIAYIHVNTLQKATYQTNHLDKNIRMFIDVCLVTQVLTASLKLAQKAMSGSMPSVVYVTDFEEGSLNTDIFAR